MPNSNSYWYDRKFVYPLIFIFVVGGVVRIFPTMLADFPLNDGGLFSVMIQNLLDADFVLPYFTTYNGGEIPYGYPPLAFYLTAFLSRLLNIPVIGLVHYLPSLISVLTIPVFYSFCRVFPFSRRQILFAVLCFSLLPRGFKWMIMGGGITRVLGLLFAILALRQIILLYQEPSVKRNIILTVLFSSLTILSHAETGWFVAISALIFFLFSKKDKVRIVSSFLVAIGVAISTSVWWATIVYRHGLETFTAAFGSGYSTWFSLYNIMLDFSEESFVSIFSVIAILGVFVCLSRREWIFPVWFFSVLIVSPRSGPNFAAIPMSLLFSFGLDYGVFWSFKNLENSVEEKHKNKIQLSIEKVFLVFIFIYTFIAAFFAPVNLRTSFDYLQSEERDAMFWINSNTDPNSTFLVLTSDTNVWIDQTSEWFPVISKRVSLAAVQGYEWIPYEMENRYKAYKELQECSLGDVSCLFNWQDENGYATHIFIPKVDDCRINGRCILVRSSLESSNEYELIYDGLGASIYAYLQPPYR